MERLFEEKVLDIFYTPRSSEYILDQMDDEDINLVDTLNWLEKCQKNYMDEQISKTVGIKNLVQCNPEKGRDHVVVY
ncbi:MAG TPA: hypothetical protein EYQ42_02680 [Thiotrichaceae bacterium]|jgi:hypothetical protein|nr:hypothetical protein [Thiotrichaceae bacterium]